MSEVGIGEDVDMEGAVPRGRDEKVVRLRVDDGLDTGLM